MTQLEEWFHTYNKRYFRGRLPACKVTWAGKGFNFLGLFHHDPPHIKISSRLRFTCRSAKLTLLHEMVHLKLTNARVADHGHAFQREMKRLAKAGAFWDLW